ncbi:MAG TPA: helix-turn-helix domain-containing protein, partial [Candidatus Thermoplasmatota archaeon]|nr:helix-turn-helix domain-containing protein [Candidatus Thermoplasmatota archaeon]
ERDVAVPRTEARLGTPDALGGPAGADVDPLVDAGLHTARSLRLREEGALENPLPHADGDARAKAVARSAESSPGRLERSRLAGQARVQEASAAPATLAPELALATFSRLPAVADEASARSRGVPAPAPPDVLLHVSSAALLGLALLALYHRLRRSELLDNRVRARVLAHVREHPASTPTPVARALGVDVSTVRHHLRCLVRHGFLVERRLGPAAFYLENRGRSEEHDRWLARAAAGRRNLAFLAALARRPGASQKDLARALGLAKSTVSRRVEIVCQARWIERREGGLWLTAEGERVLDAVATVRPGEGDPARPLPPSV